MFFRRIPNQEIDKQSTGKHTVLTPALEEGVKAAIGATAAKKATALNKLVNAIVL